MNDYYDHDDDDDDVDDDEDDENNNEDDDIADNASVIGSFIVRQSGPSNWYVNYPYCGYTSQSPININTSTVVDAFLADFIFINYDIIPAVSYIWQNNGHTG